MTILLPNKIVPIKLSLSLVISKAFFAPFDPLSLILLSLGRLDAVSAVSEPEKKADNIKRNKTTTGLPQIAILK